MKYHDMHYERIDVSEKRKIMQTWVDEFSKTDQFEEQIKILKDVDQLSREYQTYESIADLNFSRNINDQKAKEEKEYYDQISPDMQEIFNKLDKAINSSPFKEKLTKRY